MQSRSGYAAYLLRLRQVRHDDQATWLGSVQNVSSGERRQFPNVEALVTFLLAEFGDGAAAGEMTGGPHLDDGSHQDRSEES